MPSADIRAALLLSDLHSGCALSLCPPEFELLDGSIHRHNKLQASIYRCWLDFIQWASALLGDDHYLLIHNGDAIQGNAHISREGSSELVTDSLAEQQDIFVSLIQQLPVPARTLLTEGTPSHTKFSEHSIGKRLGAERDPLTGRYASPHWLLPINGVLTSITHHIQTAMRPWTRAGGLDRAMKNEQLEYIGVGDEPPRILIRAHRHVWGLYEDQNGLTIVTPAWQLLNRYGHKVVPDAIPVCGGFLLDWRNVEEGETPIVHKRLYHVTGRSHLPELTLECPASP